MPTGVKVATAYVDVVASTEGLEKQIRDSLDKVAGNTGKAAGQKIGTDISTGVRDSLDKAGGAGDVGKEIQQQINKGVDAKKVGTQIGKDISTGVRQGMGGASGSGSVAGGIGKAIQDDLIKTDVKKTSTKIGKDVSAGVREGMGGSGGSGSVAGDIGKGVQDALSKIDATKAGAKVGKDVGGGMREGLSDLKNFGKAVGGLVLPPLKEAAIEAAKEWGTEFATKVTSGHAKEALGDVANVATSASDRVADAGKAVGVNLDSVRDFGKSAADTINGLGDAAQNIQNRISGPLDNVRALAESVKAISSGDTPTRIAAIARSVDQIGKVTGSDLTGISKPIDDVAGTATEVTLLATQLKEVKASLLGLPGVSGTFKPGGALGAGILAEAGVATIGSTLAAALAPVVASLGIIAYGAYRSLPHDRRPGEIDQGPTPPEPAQLATSAATAPAGPNRLPRDGYSWQMNSSGQWVETPALGAPVETRPGHAPAPGPAVAQGPFGVRAPSGVPSTGDPEIDALNAARAARGLPPIGAAPPAGPLPSWAPRLTPQNPQTLLPQLPGREGGILPGVGVPATPSGQIPGLSEAVKGVQSITANTSSATVNATTVTVNGGVSSASPAAVASATPALSRPGFKPWFPSYDNGSGGPLTNDQLANVHKGEVILPADQVNAAGGADNIDAALGVLAGGPQQPQGQSGGGQSPQNSKLSQDFARTLGFLPASGNTGGVPGTSSFSHVLNLGNQVVGGLIDTGASAAETAVNAGIAAGTFGASAAAGGAGGAAANFGIQLGATELKRVVSFGFQAASILHDALMEQTHPFGAPRWKGYDYTQFLPTTAISSVATTTAEKAINDAVKQGIGGPQAQDQGPAGISVPSPAGTGAGTSAAQAQAEDPGGPVSPTTLPGGQVTGPPTPSIDSLQPGAAPPGPPGGQPQTGPSGGGSAAPFTNPGLTPPGGVAPPPPTVQGPSTGTQSPMAVAPPPSSPGPSLFPPTLFDDGGVWQSGTTGVNMSGRPEVVLSPQQLDTMNKPPSTAKPGDTYYITGLDADDVMKQVDRKQRLAMMQYSGRPGP